MSTRQHDASSTPMLKMFFFDYRDYEIVDGFTRQLEPPKKHEGNPILISDHPVEDNMMYLYGSVMRRPEDGLWRMWYTTSRPTTWKLAYVESEDGIEWRRPALDVIVQDGQKTHLVLDGPHGASIFYDEQEARPGWKYKLLTGMLPTRRISAFRSGDGIHWSPAAANPVIGADPDCPMSSYRAADGRYVLYCRPGSSGRRVARRESWDFCHWSEPKIVIDSEPRDTPTTEFYGLGAFPYGEYEIGTLWIYDRTLSLTPLWKRRRTMRGHQEPELVYARSGYAWHRVAHGDPWIKLGVPGSWEWGNIQPATAPVFLEDEIRFYYAAFRDEHNIQDEEDVGPIPQCGIGYASMKPDRFVGVTASQDGHILTGCCWTADPHFYVNAKVEDGGQLRVEIDDVEGNPIEGFELESCVPVQGDSTHHRLAWRNSPNLTKVADREIRLRVRAAGATIYALLAGNESELANYWKFRIPGYASMAWEQAQI